MPFLTVKCGRLPVPKPQFGVERMTIMCLGWCVPGPGTCLELGEVVMCALYSFPILNAFEDLDVIINNYKNYSGDIYFILI